MIIWGGRDISLNLVNTGGRYNPQTDTWSATTTVGVPAARDFHAAVWTGNEMLVFGGGDGGNLSYNTAYSYAPPRTMWLYQRP
jgi:N-acetylneuraminic acid mutarotase